MSSKLPPPAQKNIPQKPYDEKINLITPVGYQKLFNELRNLADVQRPKIVDEVAAAAAQGDRSENAEYIYGKKKLREIDKRMGFLKRRLDAAKVINPAKQSGDQILFGATVTVEDEGGKKKTWMIVGEDEADPGGGKISWKSPVGRALLFKVVGDLVSTQTPAGEIDLTILNVAYSPTDARK